MTLRRRVGHLEDAATVLLFCRDPWHNSEAARFAVVYEDMDSGETPAPPPCPTCGALPRVHRIRLRGVSLEDL